jgi:hypothetical protein
MNKFEELIKLLKEKKSGFAGDFSTVCFVQIFHVPLFFALSARLKIQA